MGLGKTVQSIALLAHLAETQNIWGPFLVVAPASTLHNWQQECSRFVPYFNVSHFLTSKPHSYPYGSLCSERLIYNPLLGITLLGKSPGQKDNQEVLEPGKSCMALLLHHIYYRRDYTDGIPPCTC